MRFFMPSIPAGRAEYFAVLLLSTIALYAIVFAVLEVRVDQFTGEIAYSANRLAFGLLLYMIWFVVSVINVLRRLTDLTMNAAWALLLLLPVAGFVFSLFLLLASGSKRSTYSPYGDDPYDPESWVDKSDAGKAPSVMLNGRPIYLPGEHNAWDEDAA